MPISILKLDAQQTGSLPDGISDTVTGISITKNIELTTGTLISDSINYTSLSFSNESLITSNSLIINNTTGSLTSGEIIFKYTEFNQKNEVLTLTSSTSTYIDRPFVTGLRGIARFGDGFGDSLTSLTIYDPITTWNTIFTTPFSLSGIFTNNTLGTFIWSDNYSGTWGIGTSGSNSTYYPTKIIKSSNTVWDKIIYGSEHVLALKNGTLFSWGGNSSGQLGLGDTDNRHIPTAVGSTLWSDISIGYTHSLALTTGGILYTWGGNDNGQLGKGDLNNYHTPQQIGSTVWSKIYGGFYTSFLLRATDNVLYAMGRNNIGQLGINNQTQQHIPTVVGSKSWNTIVPGPNHALGIDTSNFLWSWGYNYSGRLGLGDTDNRHQPTQVGSSTWSSVGTLNSSSIGIDSSGTLYGWGDNYNSKLGIVDPSDKLSPTVIGSTVWSKIYGSQYGYIAERSSDQQLFVVGGYIASLLGYSAVEDTPKKVNTLNFKKYEMGYDSILALSTDGYLYGWGENTTGEVGTNNTVSQSFPVQIGSTIWSDISLKSSSSFGIRASDGALFSWGFNGFYTILGLTDSNNRHIPTAVGSSIWGKVSTGYQHTLALTLNGGLLYAWGNNGYGQLGDGTTTNRSSPVAIGSTIWKQVYAGGVSSFITSALSDITYCFGDNYYGQLGLGDTSNYHIPTQLGSTIWSKIVTSDSKPHTIGLRSDGIAFVWGYNSEYQLGLGDTDNRHSPIQVGSTIWSDIAVTDNGCLLLRKSDGVIFVSGSDSSGILGSQDYTKIYTTFTSIPGNWKSIMSSKYLSLFTKDY